MPKSSSDALAQRIEAYPGGALTFLKSGFAVAAGLPEEARRAVLDAVIANFKRGVRNIRAPTLTPITKLPESDTTALSSAYSVLIGLLAESSATPDEFVAAAKGKLFSPEDEDVARALAVTICDTRAEISSAIEKAQLAGRVLPSLVEFEAVVDVRLRVVDNKIQNSVPVTIIHIETDSEQHMWLQLNRGEVEEIIKMLSNSINEIDIANNVILRI